MPHSFSIYLNRVVRKVSGLSDVPATADARPQVLVVAQRKNDPAPELPPDWRPLARESRGDSVWHAFVRRGDSGSPQL